jgi:RNA polymerase sigma factor (sigma-70 family)
MKAEAVETMDQLPPQADDAALLRAFSERHDRQAMNALFARHADAAFRTALRLCRNAADAEDAVQSAFIEILRRAAQYRGESAVKPWILGFVVNATRHKAREEGRRDAREGKAAVPEGVHAPPGGDETREAVRAAVHGLPEHYRAPVWLHYCEGLSSGEVAQALSLSENTVRSQLSRGVEQLREALAVSMPVLLAALAGAAVESAPASLTSSLATLAANAAPAAVRAGVAAKLATGAVALAAVVSTAAFIGWGGVPDDPVPPEFEQVDRRVREWQPRPEERRFDEIAWARDLKEAIRLSKESGRPVVVLAHVAYVNTGRADGGSMAFRGGPLSDPRVIALLNRRFVPVYSDSEDRRNAEHVRIYQEALAKKLVAGSECLYFVGPDGHVFDTMHVCNTTTDQFLARIEKHAGPEGAPLVAPRPQSVPGSTDGLVLHLTARYLDRDGKLRVSKGDYKEFPAEEWITLDRHEAGGLLPPEISRKGSSVEVDPALATRLLSRFYPLTGNFKAPPENRISEASLSARVVACRGGISWVRLDGRVRMEHSFFPARDWRPVEASFTGFLEADTATKEIRSVRIATERATYGREPFGVAIRSNP